MAQAAGCSPVVRGARGELHDVRPVKPNTIAKSLAIGNPADGYYALKIIKADGRRAASVTDAEIIEGIKLLARTEGIFAETAGGVTRRRAEEAGGGRHHRSRRNGRGATSRATGSRRRRPWRRR